MVTIHINYSNSLAGEDLYSKLSLVDMDGSDRLSQEEASGEWLKICSTPMRSVF